MSSNASIVDSPPRGDRVRARVAARFEGRTRFWRDWLRRRMLVLADAAAVVTAAVVVPGGAVTVSLIAFLPAAILCAKVLGLYDRDHRTLRHLTVDELPQAAAWVLACVALLTAALFVLGVEISTSKRMAVWAALGIACVVYRAGARAAWRALTPPERTLVLGDGALAEAIHRKLELFPDIHVRVVRERAVFTPEDVAPDAPTLDGIDRVIVASRIDDELAGALLAQARQAQIKLSIVPPIPGMLGTASHLSRVAELPLLEYTTWDVSRSTALGKRLVDLALSSVALVLLLPVAAAAAVALRFFDDGPVLFVQERAGLDGRPFRMLKFRTMRPGSPGSGDGTAAKRRDDPRVTRVGRFLRRSSIDELPQLVNVLRGDMSLVGPRPEQVEIVARYTPEHRFRLGVKPGLTGPMQIYGRAALGLDERLAVEREYIENLSVGRDLRILALTVVPVLRRRGAY